MRCNVTGKSVKGVWCEGEPASPFKDVLEEGRLGRRMDGRTNGDDLRMCVKVPSPLPPFANYIRRVIGRSEATSPLEALNRG